MKILAIESSCDDLSFCIYEDKKVLSLVSASQTEVHSPFGGVVPELASREHLNSIVPTLKNALEQAKIKLSDLDAIAATYAPGLIGSILVGLSFAKALSYALKKPFIGIHHIEAHLLSPLLEGEMDFPCLGLVLSGGHTHLYKISSIGNYELLGKTVDDAIGEAFDKVGKILGLPYPGGPEIDRLSTQGNPKRFQFTFPIVKSNPLYVSYSGLKTAAASLWESLQKTDVERADLAASFQEMAIRIIERMIERAQHKTGLSRLLVSGGVACNNRLRQGLKRQSDAQGFQILLPSPRYCTDNAAMIALVADFYLRKGIVSPLDLDAYDSQPLGVFPSNRISPTS